MRASARVILPDLSRFWSLLRPSEWPVTTTGTSQGSAAATIPAIWGRENVDA